MSQRMTFIVPGDPGQRTGGYAYVRGIVAGLKALGREVNLTGIDGSFPAIDDQARQSMDQALDAILDDTLVIIDGLALGGLPPLARRHLDRLTVIALVHHPLADETGLDDAQQAHFFSTEKAALSLVHGVIVTSEFTADRLSAYDVDPDRIQVVIPGVEVPELEGSGVSVSVDAPFRFLCVATLGPRKGQDLLVSALAQCRDQRWECVLAGSTHRHPEYVADLKVQIEAAGLADRITLCGELDDSGLAAAYRQADLFVLPSWYEGYGMVITEALAYGLPVITTTGGALAYTAVSEASIRVPPGDSDALAAAIMQVLTEPERLQQMVAGADAARRDLPSWGHAARLFDESLASLSEKSRLLP